MRSPVIAMHGSQDAEEGKVVVDTPHRRNHRRWSFDRISFFVVFLGVPLTIYLVFVISPFLQALYYSDGLGRLLDEVQDCRPGKLQNPFR